MPVHTALLNVLKRSYSGRAGDILKDKSTIDNMQKDESKHVLLGIANMCIGLTQLSRDIHKNNIQ